MRISYALLIQLFGIQHSVEAKMHPYWYPYYSPYMMQAPSFAPYFLPQIYANPAPQLIIPNQIISNDRVHIPQITKNSQKSTEQPSKAIIFISSESESSIQEIQRPQSSEKKLISSKKPKLDRFLGFKEGIFQKENNQPAKPTRSLRRRAVLTRARLKKYKEKNSEQKQKQRKKAIQKAIIPRKLRQSPRISKNENLQKNQGREKKPRNKQFGKLKKYLRGVVKTVDLPKMYLLKSSYLKQLEEKRENLLLRQTQQGDSKVD